MPPALILALLTDVNIAKVTRIIINSFPFSKFSFGEPNG